MQRLGGGRGSPLGRTKIVRVEMNGPVGRTSQSRQLWSIMLLGDLIC